MKVAVGISGGVDSAAAAIILKEQGFDVIGVTMTLGRHGEDAQLQEARDAAGRLGIELQVFDFSEDWRREVAEYIKATYLAGHTPNPCVRCNEFVKFSLLPRAAFALGCEWFATGHYAQLKEGRLMRAADRSKDQSYFLYRVDPEILKRTIFPLGAMTKQQVRELVLSRGIETAQKPDSQDFCGGDAMNFVGEEDRVGKIVDLNGKELGLHRGFWHYTVGKRKGLGIGGGIPYYVVRLDAQRNEVIVGYRDDAVKTEFEIADICQHGDTLEGELWVKVRSGGEPHGPVFIERKPGNCAKIICPSGIAGIAPGQSAVFYREDTLVGGGIIV